jgi:hypothetical protein
VALPVHPGTTGRKLLSQKPEVGLEVAALQRVAEVMTGGEVGALGVGAPAGMEVEVLMEIAVRQVRLAEALMWGMSAAEEVETEIGVGLLEASFGAVAASDVEVAREIS